MARPEFRQLFVDRNLAFSRPRAGRPRLYSARDFGGIFRHSRSAAGRDRDAEVGFGGIFAHTLRRQRPTAERRVEM